jgi:hypothetical protein
LPASGLIFMTVSPALQFQRLAGFLMPMPSVQIVSGQSERAGGG